MSLNHAFEIDLENHLANLAKRIDSIEAERDQVCYSGNGLMSEVRDKVQAMRHMLLVAKLLREPARESMLSKVRDSLSDIEELIALQLGVKTMFPYSACSSGELVYAGQTRPNRKP